MAENFSQLNQEKKKLEQEPGKEKLDSKLQARSLKSMCDIWPRTQFWITCQGCHIIERTLPENTFSLRRFLSEANAETLNRAFITCRIDYCRAPFSSLSMNVFQLQLLQNSAAWITKIRGRAHITQTLLSLRWLPVCFCLFVCFLIRVFYWFIKLLMVLVLVMNLICFYCMSPTEPSGLLEGLIAPNTQWDIFFITSTPRLWNSLPEDLKVACNINTKQIQDLLLALD